MSEILKNLKIEDIIIRRANKLCEEYIDDNYDSEPDYEACGSTYKKCGIYQDDSQVDSLANEFVENLDIEEFMIDLIREESDIDELVREIIRKGVFTNE